VPDPTAGSMIFNSSGDDTRRKSVSSSTGGM
jgi:hypothetical protein